MMRLTRGYGFCASHRLHSDALSEDENRELYGKCNNPHGHGHNYVVEITVEGSVDPNTGMLIQLRDLDALVGDCVLGDFDHRHMNEDLAEFTLLVPTSENLARAIKNRLSERWSDCFPPDGPRLKKVSLQETKRNRFELTT